MFPQFDIKDSLIIILSLIWRSFVIYSTTHFLTSSYSVGFFLLVRSLLSKKAKIFAAPLCILPGGSVAANPNEIKTLTHHKVSQSFKHQTLCNYVCRFNAYNNLSKTITRLNYLPSLEREVSECIATSRYDFLVVVLVSLVLSIKGKRWYVYIHPLSRNC